MSSGSAAQTASMPSSSSVRARPWWPCCGASRWRRSGASSRAAPAPPRARRAARAGPAGRAALGALHVQQHERVDARDRAACSGAACRRTRARSRPRVGGEVVHAELGRQRREPVLGGPDPLGAHLHDLAVADVLVEHPAAHAVARLHHHHRRTRRGDGRAPPTGRRARPRPPPRRRRVSADRPSRRTLSAGRRASLCCGAMASPPRSASARRSAG